MKTIKLQLLKLFLFAGLVIAGGLLLPAPAWATPITTLFNVNGTCTNEQTNPPSPCTFSGTLGAVNVSHDPLVTSVDLRFPGLSGFAPVSDTIVNIDGEDDVITAGPLDGDYLKLELSSLPIGGQPGGIEGGGVFDAANFPPVVTLFTNLSGTITRAAIGTPEPAELGMFGLGLLLIGVFTSRRRRTH